MMNRNFLPRAVLAAILLALPAAADAPRNPPQYAQFDSDSVTIVDNFTHLEWDRRAIVRAQSYSLTDAGCGFSLGNTGRLPSIKELLTILDEEPHNEYEFGKVVPKMIDALAFADTPVDLPYWSSTPAGAGMHWTLSFRTGLMQALPDGSAALGRCVR